MSESINLWRKYVDNLVSGEGHLKESECRDLIKELLQELDSLTAERDEYKQAAKTWENEAERRSRRYEACAVERDALRAKAEAAEADARRLYEALQDLTLNVIEAMRTGGWVPTPLRASFWEAAQNAMAALGQYKEGTKK